MSGIRSGGKATTPIQHLGGLGPLRRSGRGGGGVSETQQYYTPPGPTQRIDEASEIKAVSAPSAIRFADIPIVRKPKKKKKGAASEEEAEPPATPSDDKSRSDAKALPKSMKAASKSPSDPRIPSKSPSDANEAPITQEPSKLSSDPVPPMPPAQNTVTEDDLKDLFGHFLRNPGVEKRLEGESLGCYEAQVRIMALCNRYILKIKFEDLLKDKKHAELAMRIANESDRDDGWLQSVAQEFMKEFFEEKYWEKLSLRITGKPTSMRCVQSYRLKQLARQADVLCGKHKIPDTTPLGRRIYLCVLLHILDNNDQGISWSGSFELKDLYILFYPNSEMKCWIAEDTNKDTAVEWSYLHRCSTQDKVYDLHTLDKVLTCQYINGDVLPLYFDLLSANLQEASARLLDDGPWFLIYLRFHLALMSCRARKFLIRELYHLVTTYGLLGPSRKDRVSKDYASVFTTNDVHKSWIADLWSYNDPLLMAIYKFDNPIYDEDKSDETKEKASKRNSPTGSAGRANAGKRNVGRGKTDKCCEEDRYNVSYGSALCYKRHIIVHAYNNLDKPHLIADIDEIELYAAWRVPDVLPCIVRELLYRNLMIGKFAGVWSAFCAMQSDKN